MKKIALGVCSSISLYKACEIVRGFQKASCGVHVIMTANATRLVTPRLFNALSGHPVTVDLFRGGDSTGIRHVELAREVSLLLVAPATANIIGKFAAGIADDFLSTFYLAVRCPVLIAPAMHEAMFLHNQTKKNIRQLKAQGVRFVEPQKGPLASGDLGWGRLAPVEEIVGAGLRMIRSSESLRGKTILVTAGPTREYLDPVRFLSNPATGRMGYSLADEALSRGARVILVSGPTELIPPVGAEIVRVETAEEMERAVGTRFQEADVVLMAAAVCDFKFSRPSSQKIKKELLGSSLRLTRTPDILKKWGKKKRPGQILVGFAAETENLEANALKKLEEKNLDFIVVNDVSRRDIGFGSQWNRVTLLFPEGRTRKTGKKSKEAVSRVILDSVEEMFGKKA